MRVKELNAAEWAALMAECERWAQYLADLKAHAANAAPLGESVVVVMTAMEEDR